MLARNIKSHESWLQLLQDIISKLCMQKIGKVNFSLLYSKLFSIFILAIWIPRANVKLSVKSWIILLFVEGNFINFSHWILQNQIYEPNILLLNNVIAYLARKTFKAYVLSSFIKIIVVFETTLGQFLQQICKEYA